MCAECIEAAQVEADLYRNCGIDLPLSQLVDRCSTMGADMYQCHVDCLSKERCPKADFSNYFYDPSCEYECRQNFWIQEQD